MPSTQSPEVPMPVECANCGRVWVPVIASGEVVTWLSETFGKVLVCPSIYGRPECGCPDG